VTVKGSAKGLLAVAHLAPQSDGAVDRLLQDVGHFRARVRPGADIGRLTQEVALQGGSAQ